MGGGGDVEKRQSHLLAVVTVVEDRCRGGYGWWECAEEA